MKLTGAIFDFNGTLFFDSSFHHEAWNRISLNIRGIPISDIEMNTLVHGVPNIEAIEKLAPNKYSLDQRIELSKLKEEYYRNICLEQTCIKLVDGSIQLFDLLKSHKIPFTIASASIKENIDFFVTQFNLDNWIDIDTIVFDDGSYPNKITMFNDALTHIGTKKESCFIFEDSLSGVRDAISAGFVNIIVLHHDEYNKEFNSFPEVKFHSSNFEDIINFLNISFI